MWKAVRISSVGFVFVGFLVAVQGVLQALGYAVKPLILLFLRIVVFVFPIALLFTHLPNVVSNVWLTFPIVEVLTSIFVYVFLKQAEKQKIKSM